jgi:hypothetical protein
MKKVFPNAKTEKVKTNEKALISMIIYKIILTMPAVSLKSLRK